MEGPEKYTGDIKDCSHCGKALENGKMVIAGEEVTEEKKKVVLCGMLCRVNYVMKNGVGIVGEAMKFVGP